MIVWYIDLEGFYTKEFGKKIAIPTFLIRRKTNHTGTLKSFQILFKNDSIERHIGSADIWSKCTYFVSRIPANYCSFSIYGLG